MSHFIQLFQINKKDPSHYESVGKICFPVGYKGRDIFYIAFNAQKYNGIFSGIGGEIVISKKQQIASALNKFEKSKSKLHFTSFDEEILYEIIETLGHASNQINEEKGMAIEMSFS